MNSVAPSHHPDFYAEGVRRMTAEGLEVISKIMAFIKTIEDEVSDMDPIQRKKRILEFEPAKMLNQIHPVVFQYLSVEGIFSEGAFRRYVKAVFGAPKSKEDEEHMRKDRRYVYHYKNRQQALYYKYLLLENNKKARVNAVEDMFENMVKELNKDTDHMLDAYEKAEADTKIKESQITDEKRRDLVDLLKKRMSA